jgi:SAM-dependent methyltransferase
MTPEEYDAWYRTPRGSWIGETEYRLLREALALALPPGASVLDVGCGTGYFSRRLASDGFDVTGVDASAGMIGYARSHGTGRERYVMGDARQLPFPDRHFDSCVAITSLCFIREQEQALAEMVRVTRRRIALGLLNRHSLLYWQKGRHDGRGAYHGARWHTAREARAFLVSAKLQNIVVRSAIYLPSGSGAERCMETAVPQCLFFGGFLLVAGDIV